jgi:hypothetical protein
LEVNLLGKLTKKSVKYWNSLPGEVLKTNGGGETGHSAVFKELQDLPEGCLVVREVGEVGDTPFVAWDLDDIGREATSAAGVKED